jgi:hypothetical protein
MLTRASSDLGMADSIDRRNVAGGYRRMIASKVLASAIRVPFVAGC